MLLNLFNKNKKLRKMKISRDNLFIYSKRDLITKEIFAAYDKQEDEE